MRLPSRRSRLLKKIPWVSISFPCSMTYDYQCSSSSTLMDVLLFPLSIFSATAGRLHLKKLMNTSRLVLWMGYSFLDVASVSLVTIWTRNVCVHPYTAILQTISSSTWQMCHSEFWAVYSETFELCKKESRYGFVFPLLSVFFWACGLLFINSIYLFRIVVSNNNPCTRIDIPSTTFKLGDTQKIEICTHLSLELCPNYIELSRIPKPQM